MARLADSVPIDAAAADVDAVLRRFHGQVPSRQSQTPAAQPRFELARVQDEVGAPVKPALQVLIVAVGFVLLIACANVANLLLARTASRQREIAVRIALGAGRSRVIRQALTESVLLSLLGGVAGTALAFGGLYLFRTLGTSLARGDLGASATFPRLNAIAVDGRALEFALLVSIAAGILFGLAPGTRSGRVDLMDALRDGPIAKPSSFTLSRLACYSQQHLSIP
jgi:putative ABC transport system permease protein